MYANQAFLKALRDASPNQISENYVTSGVITSETLLNLRPVTDMTSLWIQGPSGIGKTTWALTFMPRPLLFVRHLDTLREFRSGFHKSIVFDDMNFTHLHRAAQLDLVDRFHPQQVHIRYAVVNLPAGTPKCFLSNDVIFLNHDEAIMRRITKVDLCFDWTQINQT